MIRLLFVLALSSALLIQPSPLRASDAASSTFYPRTLQSENGSTTTLTPEQEPVTVHHRRSWTLSYDGDASSRVAQVRLRLPRQGIDISPTAERQANGWLLRDLPLDRVGVWLLDVQFEGDTGIDRIRFKLAVDEQPFVVSTRPNAGQVALIKAMALPLTEPAPLDPATRHRAKLGQALFFDPRLSASARESCASCHVPSLAFTDGKARSRVGSRNAPSLIGISGNRWFNRDGSKDSLWSQALGPIEHPDELGLDRVSLLQRISQVAAYHADYQTAFGEALDTDWLAALPAASPLGNASERGAWHALKPAQQQAIDHHFANVGKLLATYQAQLIDRPSAFDRHAHALDAESTPNTQHLSADAQRGLMLFIGSRTQCLDCHAGTRMSNGQFHNIGTASPLAENPDSGRRSGIAKVLDDPFNCSADAHSAASDCEHLGSVWRVEVPYLLNGAFLTPGLRNVAQTGPWFHDGSATTLEAVMEHYRSPPASVSGRTEHELSPLALSDEELSQIVAFLESLDADPIDEHWITPPALAR